MKIFGFGRPFTLAQRRESKNADILGGCVIAILLGVRLLFAEEDFSYDYAAYIYYLDLLRDYSFADIAEHGLDLFPYVVFPKAPVFEIGFVVIAKGLLLVLQDPALTYAVIGAASVGIRVYVMRRLGCSWFWILLIQIYAVTLFEANAIRVGMAVTIVIFGLYRILFEQKRWGFALLVLSMVVHLQSTLFVLPFILLWPFRKRIERSDAMTLALVVLMALAITTVMMGGGGMASHEKLGDYADKASNSAGLTVTSLSALAFMLMALFSRTKSERVNHENRLLWKTTSLAIVPSLVLFMTVTSIAALGDRAWQFSFVIVASLIHTNWICKRRKILVGALFSAIAIMATVNVTLRYPLSNLFDVILPHVYIQPVL